MNHLILFITFLVGTTTSWGEVYKPIGSVEVLRSFGINIENAQRKGNAIHFEIVLPARTTFKNPAINVSNSFSRLSLILTSIEQDPNSNKDKKTETKKHLETKKDDSGKIRGEVRVTKADAKNTSIDLRYAGDDGGNPLIFSFSLLRIFEEVEKEGKDSP